ncbi:MAG: hypothetical protein ACLQAN_07775 [Acidimicrobiales bacterium]
MTVGWRRGTFPSARRPTRRFVFVIVGVIVFAIVIAEVAADVVSSGVRASRVAARTYVAEVIPVIDESTMLSSTMHLVRDSTASLDRRALEEDLGSLVAGTSENLAQLGSLGVPAPTPRSQELLRATLAARAFATRTLTGAVALAIGPTAFSAGSASSPGGGSVGPTLPTSVVLARAGAAKLIVEVGLELVISDRDYRSFVSSLPRASGRSRLPTSRWVTHPESWSKASVTTWVAQLSSRSELQIREDLAIVAVTVQPPVVRVTGLPTTTTIFATTTSTSTSSSTTTLPTLPGTTSSTTTSTSTPTTSTSTTLQLPPLGSTSVLPPTHQLSVVLVVANAGNVQISGIWAAASVVPAPSAGRPASSSAATRSTALRIGRLAPGASVEVTLRPLVVVAGDAYELWASIGTGSLPGGPVTSPPKGVGQIDEVKIKVASG